MDRMAQEAPPGAGGVLAFIGPMLMDMRRMKLSLGGFIFPVTPSITDISREHLVRAALENLAVIVPHRMELPRVSLRRMARKR